MKKRILSMLVAAVLIATTVISPVKATEKKLTYVKHVPTAEDVRLTKDIVQLATNGKYSAAVMRNGDLYTWGTMVKQEAPGSWTLSTKEEDYQNPTILAQNVSKVFLGTSVGAYIDNQGCLYMWGANMFGTIGVEGNKNQLNYTTPVKVLDNIKDFTINSVKNTAAAITNDGELYMWGNNMSNVIESYSEDGSLGSTVYTPYKKNLPGKVKKVSIDNSLTGVVLENGDCYIWGNLENRTEQEQFDAADKQSGAPIKVASNVKDVQLKRNMRSYLLETGELYTWGDNYYPEMGRESSEQFDCVPTKIKELSDIDSYHLAATSFALKKNGILYGWGNNEQATIGDGTKGTSYMDNKITPVKVTDQVQKLIRNDDDFASTIGVIKKDKSLWMWGRNNPLGIGNGKEESDYYALVPEKILDHVTMAVTDTGVTLVTCEDGSLWGWGENDRKCIGDFTTTPRPWPVEVTLFGLTPSMKEVNDKKEDNNNVVKKNKIKKITLQGMSKKIAAGKTVKLTASINPTNATNKKLQWKSSNTKYATVSQSGKVTLKKAGAGKKVTITAYATDGSRAKASYTISIKKHSLKSILLKAKNTTIKNGKTTQIKATIKTTGKDANKTLTWSSSNKKYAVVNSKGKVTTKKAGKGKKVKITACATDGTGKKASVTIKIK